MPSRRTVITTSVVERERSTSDSGIDSNAGVPRGF
jgi:hypothetical protein